MNTPDRIEQAIDLARRLQETANTLQTSAERRQQAELDRMIQNPDDKATLLLMTDQAFRAKSPHRVADQLIHILDAQGIPRFFSPIDQSLLKGFQSFGNLLPGVAVPMVKRHMREETANVILPAETDLLRKHLRARNEKGVRMNLNFLGEAILGETEAECRLDLYLQALQLPEVEVVSVKVSTIYSQISTLARDHSINVLCQRMERLYRAATRARFKRPDGSETPKFVYLDMEEYRDMEITAEVFMQTLDRLPEVSAGIVLQAYVPDSHRMQRRIVDWARRRIESEGAPVVMRIVKGANMEMERVEASIHGWPQAPYTKKIDTDANYKRMLHYGMRSEHLAAVRLGIASHNLFEMAYALVLATEQNALASIQFEMLEGMANHIRRALFQETQNLLLYAPACRKEQFIHAIGYLVRRLDENTGEENFLRHAFKLQVDSKIWRALEADFRAACNRIEQVPDAPRRQQNRNQPPTHPDAQARFVNEPDTDFSLPANSDWGKAICKNWSSDIAIVPLVIEGKEIRDRERLPITNPSRPGPMGEQIAEACIATPEDVRQAVACAVADPSGWGKMTNEARRQVLTEVARELRRARADLMGHAMIETGKVLAESDPEHSEAVDFVEYYSRSAVELAATPGLSLSPLGVVGVISPWNFPIAIPCGGIAAALAVGNRVLLKPAEDSARTAYALCQYFWRAGISKTVLQFIPGPGPLTGAALAAHPDVDAIIFTGGTATAEKMLQARPEMNLIAETGGKNATIVTALSDRDLAVKHVIQSAFGTRRPEMFGYVAADS